MARFAHWLGTPLAAGIGGALFHFVWEGALIALAVALVFAVTRNPRVRYAVACAGLFVMPPIFGVTVIFQVPYRVPAYTRMIDVWEASGGAASFGTAAGMGPRGWQWAVALWMAGVLACYLRSAGGWLAAQRVRRAAVIAASAPWQEALGRLRGTLGIRRAVALLESGLAEVPAAMGFLRPVILMPAGLLTGMPAAQIEALLLHELAHIARHDYLVNLAQCLVEGLLFYHPAVWWVSRAIRVEREHCCDDRVLASGAEAGSYADALVTLEARRAPDFAIGANCGRLEARVRRILRREERGGGASLPWAVGVVVVCAIAGGLVAQESPAGLTAPRAMIPAAPASPMQRLRAAKAMQVRQQLGDPYGKWLAEDVLYIINYEERAEFEKLESDAEREQFIRQFWERRGIAAREEHYRRIAYANGNFGYDGVAGWQTDRGRAYILYGPPDAVEPQAGDPPAEIWRYRRAPEKGDLSLRFVDAQRDGRYRQAQLAPATGFRGTIQLQPGARHTTTTAFNFKREDGDLVFRAVNDSLRARVAPDGKTTVRAEIPGGVKASVELKRLRGGVIGVVLQEPATGAYEKSTALEPGSYVFEVSLPAAGGEPVRASLRFFVPAKQAR